MPLEPNATLLHYRLVEKIGEGGMGVVWKALDTKLDREVAIKFLPEQLSDNPERVARFEREARALATLNQRNIAAIYGIEQVPATEANGTLMFLVMELVSGEHLGARLKRGPLPIDEALDVSVQVARALEAAHESGIIHRDLKPANVHVTDEGKVKVLDFGLAKAFVEETASADPEHSPTVTSAGSVAGVILGTAAYISPEQARGKRVDKRTDIWSFGCLLYECLTGRQLFGGETISDCLASILKSEPDWSALPPNTPQRVRELLQRCLNKDARERMRDVGDARQELQRVVQGDTEAVIGEADLATATGSGKQRLAVVGAAALVIGTLLGFGLYAMLGVSATDSATANRVARLSIPIPEGQSVYMPKLSPEGSVLAYAHRTTNPENPVERTGGLWLRRLDNYESRLVEDSYYSDGYVFSPDGKWLAFVSTDAPDATQERLRKVPVDLSSPPVVLADWQQPWTGLVWPTDDALVTVTFPKSQAIVRIAADGSGVAEPVPIPDGQIRESIFPVSPLPDGQNLLCFGQVFGEAGYQINVVLLDSESGEARVLVEDGDNPIWSPTGHLLFTRHDTLLAVGFDSKRLETTGDTRALSRGLRVDDTYSGAPFHLSQSGTLVYLPGGMVGSNRLLVTSDAQGKIEEWSSERRAFTGGPAVSRDGTRIAVIVTNENGLFEIWVGEAERRTLRRFVAQPGFDCTPGVFSPDGERLAYACSRPEGGGGVYLASWDGSGSPQRIIDQQPGELVFPRSFSPDGRKLLFRRFQSADDTDEILLLSLDSDGDPTGDALTVLNDIGRTELSPDGRWLGYSSDASGSWQIFVRRLDENGRLGLEVPVTSESGSGAMHWSPEIIDGRQTLYFHNVDRKTTSVTLEPGDRARFSPPRVYPEVTKLISRIAGAQPIPGNRWFLVFQGEEERPASEMHVVLHFTRELAERR